MREEGEAAVEMKGVVPAPGECHDGGQGAVSYTVDLDAVIGDWEFHNLYGVPLTARFESFEQARRYVVTNLLSFAQDLLSLVGEVHRAETYADLDVCGDGLITEGDKTTDRA